MCSEPTRKSPATFTLRVTVFEHRFAFLWEIPIHTIVTRSTGGRETPRNPIAFV